MSTSISIEPAKSAVLPGEPLVIVAEVVNGGDRPNVVDLGYDGVGNFWFEIADDSGKTVSTSERLSKFGVARSGRHTMQPGETVRVSLVMNRWCSTLLPKGEYSIVGKWDVPSAENQLQGEITFPLRVMQRDDEKLQGFFTQLKVDALHHPQKSTRRLSAEMLIYSDAPAAVEPISEFITERRREAKESDIFTLQAVESLGRIKTLKSVEALAALAFSDESILADRAVAMIHQVHDKTGDEAVRAAARRVVRTRPWPVPQNIID